MHYYQFHIGDYKSHTHHLSLIEDLAFRRLLDHYYLHEEPIRQREIARQIGMKDHEQEVLTVLDEFFVSTENGYINPRADEEIEKFRKYIEHGKKGAEKRWTSTKNREAIGGLKGGYSPPNATPIATNNQYPLTNNQINTPEGVEELVWQDFVAFRKKRKAPVTQRVVDGIQKEAVVAGYTLNDALKECVVRGWQSFKAEWVEKKQSNSDRLQNTLTQLTGGLATTKPFWGGSNSTLVEMKDVK